MQAIDTMATTVFQQYHSGSPIHQVVTVTINPTYSHRTIALTGATTEKVIGITGPGEGGMGITTEDIITMNMMINSVFGLFY